MRRIVSGMAIGILMLGAGSGLAAAAPPAAGAHVSMGGHVSGLEPMQRPAVTAPSAHTAASPAASTTTPSGKTKALGQPNASCETSPSTPGQAAAAPGSAFNPDGVAGTKYAGEQPQNSKNPAAVSQYDAACAHQPH
jgi:hypothetical protein